MNTTFMDPRLRIVVAYSQLDRASYYDLLTVPQGATQAALQKAFHRFALAYHPDRHIDSDPEMREMAKRIFERGVEAYTILRNPDAEKLYRANLAAGKRRLSPLDLEKLQRASQSRSGPPPPERVHPKTFPELMRTPDGRDIAERVESLLYHGRFVEAYQQISLLEQAEPQNPAVKSRAEQIRVLVQRQSSARNRPVR